MRVTTSRLALSYSLPFAGLPNFSLILVKKPLFFLDLSRLFLSTCESFDVVGKVLGSTDDAAFDDVPNSLAPLLVGGVVVPEGATLLLREVPKRLPRLAVLEE